MTLDHASERIPAGDHPSLAPAWRGVRKHPEAHHEINTAIVRRTVARRGTDGTGARLLPTHLDEDVDADRAVEQVQDGRAGLVRRR
jgi:hypothetical protein